MPTDRVITFKVTDSFYNHMVEAMEAEGHNSMSDFVKFAVRYYMMNCGNADNASRGGIPDAIPEETTSSGRT